MEGDGARLNDQIDLGTSRKLFSGEGDANLILMLRVLARAALGHVDQILYAGCLMGESGQVRLQLKYEYY